MNVANVLTMQWRRLDVPGRDACRLERRDGAWHLEGTASFVHVDGAALLGYRVICDDDWRTRRGSVRGRVGPRTVSADIVRTAHGQWLLNGARNAGVDACVDLDFGFTPATNFAQLKRCNLAIGGAADVPVAWWDVDVGSRQALLQRYERRSETTYWYESPTVAYEALLELGPNGFVARYPGLWQAEA